MCAAAIAFFLLLTVGLNIILIRQRARTDGIYRVEAKRLADEIAETGSYDLAAYPHLTKVYSGDDLYRSDAHYLIIEAGGTLYRVEYETETGGNYLLTVNCILVLLFLLLCGLLLYLWRHIIAPFGRLNNVP